MFPLVHTISAFSALAHAAIPTLDGYRVVWSDDFNGPSQALPGGSWDVITADRGIGNDNGGVQIYTNRQSNAHLSGDGQLYIIPNKHTGATTYWDSARLETFGSWGAPAGKAMIMQAEIRVPDFTGSPARYEGLWPAFWTKGQINRQGTPWPKCGEWDILEVTDHMSDKNATNLHFATLSNPRANAGPKGSGWTIPYQGGAYHTWVIKIDRRNSNWQQQAIVWYRDGAEVWRETGASIGNSQQWAELTAKPYYIILQVAVGGNYPGFPIMATVGGFESSMRVKYVAVYEST